MSDVRSKHSWAGLNLAEKVSVVVAPITIALALFAWLRPTAPPTPTPTPTPTVSRPAPTASVTTSSAPDPSPSSQPPTAAVDYLAGPNLRPMAGGDRLVPLPRALRTRSEYTSHALTVKCPTNETAQTVSEVIYELRGQYLDLDATVRPYYPKGSDQRAVTYVTAVGRFRQPDGGFSTKDVGEQLTAKPNGSAELSAVVEDAQQLVLRVRCSDPNGFIVLTDARLTVRE